MNRFVRILVVVAALFVLTVPESSAADGAVHSPNLTPVANLAYADRYGTGANQGTDIEFARLKYKGSVRDFALAGTYDNGLQLIDISKPSTPTLVGRYDCGVSQGDVQVFSRGARTYATYTMDAGYTLQDTSRCVQEAKALGLLQPTTPHPLDIDPIGAVAPDASYGRAGIGTYIVDITDPTKPRTVSFVGVPKGSHNQTVHPSGDYLYNSNSQLYTTALNAGIEVYDIRDFAKPRLAAVLPLPPVPGLGSESHDITFNETGTRAYSAALSHTADHRHHDRRPTVDHLGDRRPGDQRPPPGHEGHPHRCHARHHEGLPLHRGRVRRRGRLRPMPVGRAARLRRHRSARGGPGEGGLLEHRRPTPPGRRRRRSAFRARCTCSRSTRRRGS